MLVRTLRAVDVQAIASFQRRTGVSGISAHSWTRVQPDSGRFPVVNLLSATFGQGPSGHRTWIAEDNGRMVGLGMARPRAGGLVWDAIHLNAESDANIAAADLL